MVVASGTYDNKGGDNAGTYALDGIGIELRFDSGKIERKTFAVSADREQVFVRFGGDMMPKKK